MASFSPSTIASWATHYANLAVKLLDVQLQVLAEFPRHQKPQQS
jgi:hypothetical protein